MRPMQDDAAARREAGSPEAMSAHDRELSGADPAGAQSPGERSARTDATAPGMTGATGESVIPMAAAEATAGAAAAAGESAEVASGEIVAGAEVAAEVAPAEPEFDELGQPLPARAFAPSIGDETRAFGSLRPLRTVCMWCNGPLESADLDVCPHCGAALKPVSDDIEIPGVTIAPVDLKKAAAAAAEALARTLARPAETVTALGMRPDLEPPSDAVRRAMQELAASGQPAGRGGDAADAKAGAGATQADAPPSADPADPPARA